MLKKNIAIAISIGALSLTGCGLAPSAEQAAGQAGAAVGTASTGQASESASAKTVSAHAAKAAAAKTAATKAAAAKAAAATAAVAKAAAAKTAAAKTATAAVPAAVAVPAAATAAVPAKAAPAVVAPAAASAATAAAQKAPAAPAQPAPAPVAAAATTPASGTQAASTLGWGSVVAGDEFNYTGTPDRTKWSVYNSPGHAGKGVRSPQAWSVASGVATVSGDSAGTTGGMSAKFANQKYGRWETRMKTNRRDSEYHPVLILNPVIKSSTCDEVDYAESTADTTLVKFFLHYACSGTKQTYASKAVDTTQWHNYAVEWTPTGITGYIDGVKTFTDTIPAHQPSGSVHQTLQLDWFPDGSSTTPSWMQVDWVRVYK
ncbi:glycoside hydrolase family 16 protein [Arthrobacter sp. AFG20]|uniref:glycoside hydrolase family 16 protein n=1 Tax=Arthrobacter sp. AFG20 TaxID=1688671 RepID=UPI0021551740|nr:glycoside hydrolase family 16 protein [Arthrobacter sp. AFG20]